MPTDKGFYSVSNYGDSLQPGQKLKIEHIVSLKKSEISINDLVPLPTAELERRREDSVRLEKAAYDQVLAATAKWEEQAAISSLLDSAFEYLKVQPCKHSSNEWHDNEHGDHTISNMTYTMSWRVSEDTRYDRNLQKSVPVSWHLSWYIETNPPATGKYGGNSEKIAGQNKKRFTDKAAMEKYLKGRIAAYSHLFTEISPPVPKEYERSFMVNGLLLPGYTATDGDAKQADRAASAEKPSVLAQIRGAAQSPKEPRKDKPSRDKSGPEH